MFVAGVISKYLLIEVWPLPPDAVPVLRNNVVFPSATPFRVMSAPIFPKVTVPDVAAILRVVLILPTTGWPMASESIPPDPRITL